MPVTTPTVRLCRKLAAHRTNERELQQDQSAAEALNHEFQLIGHAELDQPDSSQ